MSLDPDSAPTCPAEPYAFEPELIGQPPRLIPESVHQGRRARGYRSTLRWLVGLGVAFGRVSATDLEGTGRAINRRVGR